MAKTSYKNIVDVFASDIRSGKLTPGVQLPTHRQLAKQYGIALATASKVYRELIRMGLVAGETGRGSFVREVSLPKGWGTDQQPMIDDIIDLNFNYPSLPQQPDQLRLALRQLALSGDLESLLRYQPHAGRDHERAIVTNYLRSRGLITEAKNTLIVGGAQHGLISTAIALLKAGDVMAVDALTYSGIKALAQTLGIELLPIPNQQQCLDINYLTEICTQRKVKALYLQPTVHNPLGWVMSESQRHDIVEIARRHDLIIIEDAPYAFLELNAPQPIATLAPDRTVYVSSLSKSVATGLRFGFISAPNKWVSLLERAIRASTWNTPAIITALACNWIEDGTVALLEEEKRIDAAKRQTLFAKVFTGYQYQIHPHSYFTWLPLLEEGRSDQVVKTLLEQGISASTAEPFSTSSIVPHAIRLALGSVDMNTLKNALETVKDVIEKHRYQKP